MPGAAQKCVMVVRIALRYLAMTDNAVVDTVTLDAITRTTLTLDTACPLDCPDGCSLTVTVKGGRLLSVDATPVDRAANPFTAGFICQKVKHHAERVYGSDRVLTPLVRTGAKGVGAQFREASWEEALTLIADHMRAAFRSHGPGSVLPYLYNSSAGVISANSYGERVGAELGLASLDHTICAATMGAATKLVLGGMMTADPLDIVRAKYIVVWGANPTISNTHLPPMINDAVRNGGAKLVVIDPRRTAIAARAHRHIALRPGTDVVLAAAMARHLNVNGLLTNEFIRAHVNGADEFLQGCDEWTLDRAADVTGLEGDEIAAFAEEWASSRPAMLRIGWGMERNMNGGSGITSALALPILMGHFGQRGSGILHSTSSGNGVDTTALTDARCSGSSSPVASNRRVVSQNDLAEVLNAIDPKEHVNVLIVQGANPALMNLDQNAVLRGLKRADLFTVVHEQVMTDTCAYADVILPATTHFEVGDFVDSYGSFVVQEFPAVIDRVGESRTNAEFFAALGEKFDLHLDAEPSALHAGLRAARPVGVPRAEGTTVQMVDVFPQHPDKKFRLIRPEFVSLAKDERFPLILLSPANNKTINSMFGERHADAPTIHMHADDASARSIVDGQQVLVFNEGGEIELTVSVSNEVRRGVISVAKGFWARSFGRADGLALNALIPRRVEPLASGACFNDAQVNVRPV